MVAAGLRLGIDLGGTKIAGVVLDENGDERAVRRIATPGGYGEIVAAIAGLIGELEQAVGYRGLPIGVGHPGAISPASGLLKNANSICLNGRPLQRDLQTALGRPVTLANDANCLGASELFDGAGVGVCGLFAAILGTGVGGAIVIDGRVRVGPHAIAGEWGHNPLPWPRPDWDELPGPNCWCGRRGCIETWLSGPGLTADHRRRTGTTMSAETIVAAAAADADALETLERYEDRLARALAHVINLFDPELVVLGGGLSRVARLYRQVPQRWSRWVFSDVVTTRLAAARHGDASGARGAARLGQSLLKRPSAV
ncbi:MAG: ROK family protein [Gammaproteobacteria bacterium]|nr:ROK family protein [Gammaproteobacteria bacterium]